MNEIARLLIKRHEGERRSGQRHVVYDDATGKPIRPGMLVKGHPTIGYGRALDVRGISQDEADALLDADLAEAEETAQRFGGDVWEGLGEVRQAVLIDMAHNLGARGLNGFVRMRFALLSGDFDGGTDEMLDSAWRRQVGESRAGRLADMMRTGAEVA